MEHDVKEALLSAHSYLERLIIGLDKKGEDFMRRDRGALSDIPDVVDGINWLLLTLMATRNVHAANADATGVKQLLNDLIDAVANEDFTLICDLVEYEIKPVLCGYYDALDEILFSNENEIQR